MLRCCCFCISHPQTVHQGGNHLVDMAVEEKGASGNGVFLTRGKLKKPPEHCLNGENQKRMLGLVRQLVLSPKLIHHAVTSTEEPIAESEEALEG